MSRFRALIGTAAAVMCIAGFGAAPTAEASPLWRGDSWLVPNDGDSGGISTGINAWMYHDETHRLRAGFASKGEYIIAENFIRSPHLTVCAIVRIYTIEGQYVESNSACRSGYGTNRVNWSYDEGYATRVTLQVIDVDKILYERTQTGGRT